ncbi:MAG: hypothetical protein QOF51_2985 [Chloroflexota bacterium]|nr:hypothetical protein [Chloroflexota bacterium]
MGAGATLIPRSWLLAGGIAIAIWLVSALTVYVVGTRNVVRTDVRSAQSNARPGTSRTSAQPMPVREIGGGPTVRPLPTRTALPTVGFLFPFGAVQDTQLASARSGLSSTPAPSFAPVGGTVPSRPAGLPLPDATPTASVVIEVAGIRSVGDATLATEDRPVRATPMPPVTTRQRTAIALTAHVSFASPVPSAQPARDPTAVSPAVAEASGQGTPTPVRFRAYVMPAGYPNLSFSAPTPTPPLILLPPSPTSFTYTSYLAMTATPGPATAVPTVAPTTVPTAVATGAPTANPTAVPTIVPSVTLSPAPTATASATPTA